MPRRPQQTQRGPTVPGSESTCWHLISFVLPTFLRLVGEEEDAVAEDLGLRELQRRLSGPVLEQALAGAHHDRVDQEPELVEEALTQQRTDKRGAPEDGDVLPGLLLELGDLSHDVLGDQLGVPPGDRLHGRGDNKLWGVVEVVCVRTVFGGLVRPVSGEDLVRPPAQQKGVRRGHPLAGHLPHFVCEVGDGPILRRLHNAVQRHHQRRNDLSHLDLLLIMSDRAYPVRRREGAKLIGGDAPMTMSLSRPGGLYLYTGDNPPRHQRSDYS